MVALAGVGYFQMLHMGEDHWITLSDHDVLIYDGVYLQLNYYTLK